MHRNFLFKLVIVTALVFFPNFLFAGQSGDEDENVTFSLEVDNSDNSLENDNTENNQLKIKIVKTEKIVDPFSKNLIMVKLFRKDLTAPSVYPVSSMKLVGTIMSDDPDNFALVTLPGGDDQVVVKQGQRIGKHKALVKKIEKDLVLFEENKKMITLELYE